MAKPSKRTREIRHLQDQLTSLAVSETQIQHSGSLPSPEALARYEQLMPGLADRIVKMAEAEASHRRSLEQAIITAQVNDAQEHRRVERTGQHYALIVACLTIVLGFVAIFRGYAVAGSALSGGTIVSLVGIFIYGRERKLADAKAMTASHAPEPPTETTA